MNVKTRAAVAAHMLVAALALLASDASAASSKGDPTVNRHTRAYIDTVRGCQAVVAVIRLDIRQRVSDIRLADDATQARDICQGASDSLLDANTDHFDKQATTAWYGVDRYKSGLNAMLAYIDDPRPTKLIEVRDKLAQGDSATRIGIRGINLRRAVYGLKAY